MNARSICVKLVAAAALFLTAPWLYAQDGLKGALSRTDVASRLTLRPFERKLAVADFDNDRKPDGAVLIGSEGSSPVHDFRIEVHLSHDNNTDLTFESLETTLTISAWDVNKDGAIDLVVEHSLTHKRLFVWLNDGRGGFHRGRIEDFPSAETAAGERVELPSCPDHPAVYLGPQKSTERGILTVRSLPRRAPPPKRQQTLNLSSRLKSAPSSHKASRAPPLFS